MKEHVLIAGGTGFIGRNLVAHLKDDYNIEITTRSVEKAKEYFGDTAKITRWNGVEANDIVPSVENADIVINLIGENLAYKKWSEQQKEKIIKSRVDAAYGISKAIELAENNPRVFIQGSAAGYYGSSSHTTFTEDDPPGNTFLAHVATQWEDAIFRVKNLTIRYAIVRTGVVLGEEGALPKLMKPFKYFTGIIPGTGQQWVSWIHINDQVNTIRFLIETEQASGIFNLTAPNPVTMKGLLGTVSKTMKRPIIAHVPSWLIKMVMGQMAEETILSGQKVVPQNLQSLGYKFLFPDIKSAISDIVTRN